MFPEAIAKGDSETAWTVVSADFVNTTDGTGVVHTAVMYGEDDYALGMEVGFPAQHTVGMDGKFIKGTHSKLDGRYVKDCDSDIINILDKENRLYREHIYTHDYPHCWRTDHPLLYYAMDSWFVRMTAVKDQIIKFNSEVEWAPEWTGTGRVGEWLRNIKDWAISRERYWGTPLPVWICQECGSEHCIGSIEEMNSLKTKDSPTPQELHRPYVDDVKLSCSKCSGEMVREPYVMDCWFDSGCASFAQWHYPFENEDKFKGSFPVDYICEAVDQTRGWIYSLHALSTLLKVQPAYKNVICLGLILDEKGRKMSKRVGNVVEPLSVLDEHGADALRWYLFTASHPGEPRRFSGKLVSETLRKVMLTLWNIYSFFVGYAEIDKFDPSKTREDWKPENELDRWVLSELQTLIAQTHDYMEGYDPTNAGRRIQEFIDQLSNWYVRRSRRRFWRNEGDADKLSGYITLHTCLVTVAKLMAPLAPFVAEEIYQSPIGRIKAVL